MAPPPSSPLSEAHASQQGTEPPTPPTRELLLEELAALYARRGKVAEFNEEREFVAAALPLLSVELDPVFVFKARGLGSTATVWEVHDPRLKQARALKLARPRLHKLPKILRVLRAEQDLLASLSHQNITRIHLAGEIEVAAGGLTVALPYFLMDYLEGVDDFDKYIFAALPALNGRDIISLFQDVVAGLSFLHRKGVVHCDIKPANLLIAPAPGGLPDSRAIAMVADLGYSKYFRPLGDGDGLTELTFTPRYAHPELTAKLREWSESGAAIVEIPRRELRPAFDLFALGKSFRAVLLGVRSAELAGEASRRLFAPYQWRYLALICSRLLDGVVEQVGDDALTSDVLPFLGKEQMKELRYPSADAALEDLEKLLDLYDVGGAVPEIRPTHGSYIQIPGQRVPLTMDVRRVINHPAMRRLARVTQLGPVCLVYPGANHTRFEHSLGVFAAACSIVRALWYDEMSCVFRSLMSSGDIKAVLGAALVHDLGQYPLGHELTEIASLFDHERWLEALLYRSSASWSESLASVFRGAWGITAEEVLAILRAGPESSLRSQLLRSIVSGPLDADKVDYLIRDSVHLGVGFGRAIDWERLLGSVTVCFHWSSDDAEGAEGDEQRRRRARAEVGVVEKGLAVADAVWQARREMFRQVYWQHTVRAVKAMLGYVVRRVIRKIATPEDEAGFGQLFFECVVCGDAEAMEVVKGRLASVEEAEAGGVAPAAKQWIEAGDGDERTSWQPSQLPLGDDAVLRFFWLFADEAGRRMIECLRSRLLYQRAAVFSRRRVGKVYERIYNWFAIARDDAERVESWRERIESGIVAEIQRRFPDIGEGTLPVPLILVDVPVKTGWRSAGPEALWFVPEEETREEQGSEISFPVARASEIEIERPAFDLGVGKIRVFAHPEWAKVVAKVKDPDPVDPSRWQGLLQLLLDAAS